MTNPKADQQLQQLIQTERLAALGQLAAGISHELNNPIGYILSNMSSFEIYLGVFSKLIKLYQIQSRVQYGTAEHLELSQQIQALEKTENIDFLLQDCAELLRDSQQGAHRVKDLVLDLRRFAHPDQAQWQTVDITNLLQHCIRLVRSELRQYAQLELKLATDLPAIAAQPSGLTQVIVNILINAAQAVEAKAADQGIVQLESRLNPPWLEIRISDNGPGVAADIRTQIFEPFFTTKVVGQGTGLGLAICQRIVEQHQGQILVGTATLGGAEFTIQLPLVQQTSVECSA